MMAVNVRLNPVGVTLSIILLGAGALYIFGIPNWFKSQRELNMRELLAVSIELAKRGGLKVHEIRTAPDYSEKVKGKTDEGAKEMLTSGDVQSHRAMMYGFNKAFPGLKVISEEHDTQPPQLRSIAEPNKNNPELAHLPDRNIPMEDIAVWIDPLDATQEYTENLTWYVTTMVCASVRGSPILGVIHFPFSGETFWGWHGEGYSKNILPQWLKKDSTEKKTQRLIVSRSHAGSVKEVAQTALGGDTEIIPAGGAGYKTIQVVKGNADAYVHVTAIKKWDICAGNAIIQAVQGKMTTLDGSLIDYAASGNVRNEQGLLATLRNYDELLKSFKGVAETLGKHKSKREASTTVKKETTGNS